MKNNDDKSALDTSVYVSFNDVYKGKFTFKNSYRVGVKPLFNSLKNDYNLAVVSGDNEGERVYLEENLPEGTDLLFQPKARRQIRCCSKSSKRK